MPVKKWINVYCKYAHLHSMSIIATKIYEILLSGFKGVALTICFSSIFYFGEMSKFKGGIIPSKLNRNFLQICTLCPSLLHSVTKFRWEVSKEFRWTKTNKQTNKTKNKKGLTDGSKLLHPPQLVAWGIKYAAIQSFLKHNFENE